MVFNLNRITASIPIVLLVFLGTSPVFGHSGHQQEDAPTISIPDVVAQVNGTNISKDPIIRELKKAIRTYKKKGMPLTPEQEKTAARKLIEDEIDRTLLVQKAKAIGVDITNPMVESKMGEIKTQFKSDAVFEHTLADEGLTLDQYRVELKTDLYMEQVIRKEIQPAIRIDEKELKSFYDENKDKFGGEEKRRASVILIKVNPKGGPDAEIMARKKIESIYDQLKNGADFASMAQKHSQDSLKAKGGDLGYFARSQMFAPFAERAFKMKVEDLSEIFQTHLGFHILKLTDIKPDKIPAFDDVKKEIAGHLREMRAAEATRKYVQELRKTADVKTYF
ncbi:MAG: hypothetical protein COV67_08445 [Nitrospinae bacterium CG11_big_fil_rev_8_21_14_0_20_56_8]|nr:MAG: hypothetical protein COV67_08445 [Nitrospinae bacterium CG11_big_fil_rev_8_21_14_0_20_56_8]